MRKIRVLQGTISKVQQQYGGGPFTALTMGVTFDIGSAPEVVTIGGPPVDLLENEYLAVVVKPGLFSDRGSIALAYRRLGQKADAKPSPGYSGFFCALTAAIILYSTVANLDLRAHPISPVVGAVLAALLVLLALHRRRMARDAAQMLADLSLDQTPLRAVEISPLQKPKDVARWVVLAFGIVVMLLLCTPLVLLGPKAPPQALHSFAELAMLGLVLLGLASLVFVFPSSRIDVTKPEKGENRKARGAAVLLLGLMLVCGGIFSALNGPDHAAYLSVAHGGGGLNALAAWSWNVLSDAFGPWGPAVVVTMTGLAVCAAAIKSLRRAGQHAA
jgi:hypothetical protein